MSNEIAVRDTDGWAPMLPAINMLAQGISDTEFVPKALRGKQYAVAACILTGREIGIGPMESLAKIHMVDGRPSMSSELMRSLVLRAGHAIEFTQLTDQLCTIRGKRAGSESWTELSWSMKDAQRIGVANKDVWKKYPRNMLSARATSELCRLIFPDALGGLSFTPEDIEDEKVHAVKVLREPKPDAPQSIKRAAPPIVEPSFDEPAVDTSTGEIVDAEVVDDSPALITDAQMRKMRVLLSNLDMKDRDVVLQYVRGVVGRDVESSKSLTKDEASRVIEALSDLEAISAPNTNPEPDMEDNA